MRVRLVVCVTGIVVLGVLLACRQGLVFVLGESSRQQAARCEGALLASNTIRHQVSNKLAVTIGYTQILADDPRLPREVAAEAGKALASARAAAEVVHQLADQPLERLVLDTRVAGPALLDLSGLAKPTG
jgi:predicted component of type VI protein secretion system